MVPMKQELEREMKFDVSEDFEMPPLEGVTSESTVRLFATYWDTPERRLLRWGHTLRYRHASDGSEDGWTLKLSAPRDRPSRDMLDRTEISVDGRAEFPPGELKSRISGVIRRAKLVPIATIETTRRALVIEDRRDPAGAVEASDDTTSSTVDGEPRPSFRQIEIEAVGRPSKAMLDDVAERLTDAGAIPTGSTKLQLALGTASGPEVHVSKLRRNSSVVELVRFAIASGTVRLIEHDPEVRLGSDPEAVHQARVATRRLRSDLKTLEPLLSPTDVARLRDDLAWVGGLLGAVRDLDVLTDRVEERSKRLPRVDDEASASIVSVFRDDRRVHWLELVEAMGSARYVNLLETLVKASHEPPATDGWSYRRARPILRKLVQKAWRRTARAVAGLDREPADPALHEVRKRAKRARYAAELGRGLFGKPARRLAKRLEGIQDELGELQDAVVAEESLRSLADREIPGPCRLLGGHDLVLGGTCPRVRPPSVASDVEIREQEAAPPMAQVGHQLVVHTICIASRRHSSTQTYPAVDRFRRQRTDQHVLLALTRRRSGVRVPQRPPQEDLVSGPFWASTSRSRAASSLDRGIIGAMPRYRKPKVDKAGRVSAGILLWRRRKGRVEVLLGHPGSPFSSHKDKGAWTVLKGEIHPGEQPATVARREFEEETGHPIEHEAPMVELGGIQQNSGKVVVAWAVEGDLDPGSAVSNTFDIEWPPGSGRIEEFPEIDRVAWFGLKKGRVKIKGAQEPFLDRLDRATRAE